MYTKTITPAFETRGKRRKLVGYIGELRDGALLIHAQEYSTNHDAEVALDSLMFDILTDLQMDNAPATEEDDSGELTSAMADDDYAEAMAESAQGTYNGFVPSTCVFCHKPHHPQDCPEMRALLFAPELCKCGAPVKWSVPFASTPRYEFFCDACYAETNYMGDPISAPLDVDFAPIAWEV